MRKLNLAKPSHFHFLNGYKNQLKMSLVSSVCLTSLFAGPANSALAAELSSGVLANPFATGTPTQIQVLSQCEKLTNSLAQWVSQPNPSKGFWPVQAVVTQSVPTPLQTVTAPNVKGLTRYGDILNQNITNSINSVAINTNSRSLEFSINFNNNATNPIFSITDYNARYHFLISSDGGVIMQVLQGITNIPLSQVVAGQLQCHEGLMYGFIENKLYTINFTKKPFNIIIP